MSRARSLRRVTLLCALAAPALPRGAWADLPEYLKKPEPAFAWNQTSNDTTPEGKIYSFDFTSQTWRGGDWKHQLRVYEPAEIRYPKLMLLFITGGSTDSKPKPDDHATGFVLARACGARVAVLPQVPNQPLLGGKEEDDLIGETFVNYINTQEDDWPLLFPMVKSAVKAMDALEAWAKEKGHPVDGFVVTGASKRGWTTWLTGASDSRVEAIAPMVIPTLNMKAQAKHQMESWGFYSEQIEDYTRRGLTEKFDDPVGSRLWKMVDPWSYLDRIQVPVLQINGTNDRYWTLDSMNLFWDDIEAPKYVVYLPNAGHGLDQNREWATNGLGAFFRHVAIGKPMPTPGWKFITPRAGRIKYELELGTDVKSMRVWRALSSTLDFREAKWAPIHTYTREALTSVEKRVVEDDAPDRASAYFMDVAYEIDGLEYHLTSTIAINALSGATKPESPPSTSR